MFIPRLAYKQLEVALNRQDAVALLGARQVGKTTLASRYAKQLDHLHLDLQDPEDRRSLEQPTYFLRQYENRLVILDEVHRVPEIFAVLRVLIDEGRRKNLGSGRFLILGSASIDLLKQSSETLAGRIEFVHLDPISVTEIGEKDIDKLWLRGGFPRSYIARDDDSSITWRKSFILTYVERDLFQFIPRVPTHLLYDLWTMLAHDQGATLNSARLARALEVSSATIAKYVDVLRELLLVRKLIPFRGNIRKRLEKRPKIFVRDSGIVHALLNIVSKDELLRNSVCGYSWEGFVIEQICTAVEDRATPMYYRTADGAEVDLLLEWHRTRDLWAIEIKRSLIQPSRGFYYSIDVIKPSRSFIICARSKSFFIREGVEVHGLAEFLKLLVAE